MDEPFLQFVWPVAPAYHWQDWLDDGGGLVVVAGEGFLSLESPDAVELAWQQFQEENQETGPVLGPVLDSGSVRTYQPMQREHAALFQAFAGLDYQDRDAILLFASKYGLLGVEQQEQGPLSSEYGGHYAVGESHLTWAREICLMREAMRLSRTRTGQEDAEEGERYRKHRLDPARYRKRRGKRLEWLFNLHLQHVQPRMAFEQGLPPRLSFAPLTLLAAMWLQLGLAVAGDKHFQACKHCRKLFEISTELSGFRRHREFCSDICKTNDYRKRKRTAVALAGEGKSLADIATQIDTSETTVAGWLDTSRRREQGKK